MVKCARVSFSMWSVFLHLLVLRTMDYGFRLAVKKIFKKSNTELMWSVVNDQVINVPPNHANDGGIKARARICKPFKEPRKAGTR